MSGKDNVNTIKAVYEAFGRGDVGFIADDECAEVTPKSVRLRKVLLSASARGRLNKSGKPPRS